jgi:hypothetical protein
MKKLTILVRKRAGGGWAIYCPQNGQMNFDTWEEAIREGNICHARHAIQFERPARV